MRKTLKEAVLFANATRTTIEKAKEEQYESMEVLYKEKENWYIKYGKLKGNIFVSGRDKFALELKEESELPSDYNIAVFYFAERTDNFYQQLK